MDTSAPANDQFANPDTIAEDMAIGMIDDIDLMMIAELTADFYAIDGFFGFDPYGGQKPEELTIWTKDGFLPAIEGPAHYELRFPHVVSDIGQIRCLYGPPQRVLVPGPALDKVELSFSTDGLFELEESGDLQSLQSQGETLGTDRLL